MGLFRSALDYLGAAGHWTGYDGILPLTLSHLKITLIAVLLAAAVGLTLGIALGHARRGGAVVTVLANLTRAVPVLGLLALLATNGSLGVTATSAILALAVFAIAPILTNAYTGMSTVDPETLEAASGLGMSGRQVLLGVELPLALPLLAAGLRTAVLQVFATATIASFVGASTLGNLIADGQATSSYDQVLAGAICIAVIAVILDLLLGAVQALVTPGTANPLRRVADRRAAEPAEATAKLP
ncbi:MAG TPA: ABC transporter permease [Frankiaceae bacterium]|nr:ABC transporter permease [Frankiaceae bacterium]